MFFFFIVLLSFNTMKRQRERDDYFKRPIAIMGDQDDVEKAKELCKCCDFDTVEFIFNGEREHTVELKLWVDKVQDKICHIVDLSSHGEHANLREYVKCGVSNQYDWPSFLRLFQDRKKIKMPHNSPFYVDKEDEHVHDIVSEWVSLPSTKLSSLIGRLIEGEASHVKILISEDAIEDGHVKLGNHYGAKKDIVIDQSPKGNSFIVLYDGTEYRYFKYHGVQHKLDLQDTTLLIIGVNGHMELVHCDETVEKKFADVFSTVISSNPDTYFGTMQKKEISPEETLEGISLYEIRFKVFEF